MPPHALASIPLAAYLALVTIPLAAADLRERRLPNLLVLPGYAVAAACWVLGAILGNGFPIVSPVCGLAALLGFGALAAVGGLGMGDAKLAGVIGCALGLHSAGAAVAGLALGCLLGAVWAAGARVAARARVAGPLSRRPDAERNSAMDRARDSARQPARGIPLGPALLGGLWGVGLWSLGLWSLGGVAWGISPPISAIGVVLMG